VKVVGAALGLAYPFIVYLGLSWLSARTLALVIGAALLVRAAIRVRGREWRTLMPLAGVAVAVGSFIVLVMLLDEGRYFKALPVVVNVAFCVAFARTLVSGPPMIERFARLQHAHMPPNGVPYCRRVTIVWAIYFALNALVILWLALTASLAVWTVYTGIIAYLFAGALIVGEIVYRSWRFRYYEDGPTDALMRRIFPPRVGT
jgi:uncharacterized membrane protein